MIFWDLLYVFKNQNTLFKIIDFEGIGLHSGEKVKIILTPAAEDTGIKFKINNSLIGFIYTI